MQPILKDYRHQGQVETMVQGAHRHKYFKRPIIPVLQSVPPEIVMQIPEEKIMSAKERIEEPKAKTVEIQTMFRESEAQTDPFTPDYIIEKENAPEVLTIAHLKYGKGLPASMAEMELIEQMREKRAFENALPPTSDEACFILRRKLMEEQEFREWNKREEDIKRIQNERLNLLQSALVEREKETEEKHAQRTEEIRLKKTENKERHLAKIQRKRIKVLRKMFKARKNVEIKGKKRDIIEDYANFGSTVYAPITRDGLSLDKKANKYEVQPEALSTYQGLQELTRTLPNRILESKVSVATAKLKFIKSQSRKEVAHKAALKKAQATIDDAIDQQEIKDQKDDKDSILKNVKVRPPTPIAKEFIRSDNKEQHEQNDKKQRAIVLLQRLLRGRARQNMMFEGKEKRLDLIAELRATEEWKAASDLEEEKVLIENYQERVLDGTAEALQSQIIASTLDHLSKELVRFKQERRIAAMVRLAEDVRRRREAEESGRRQAEQILRQREDVLYKELMSVHQGSVDSYLQNIITNTIDNTSSLQAYEEAKLKVQTLNKFIDKAEERNKPEVLIKDLVSSFLIPDVQRKKLQRQLQFEEKKFLEAARKTIQSSVANAGQKLESENVLTYDPRHAKQ
eukprot:403368982